MSTGTPGRRQVLGAAAAAALALAVPLVVSPADAAAAAAAWHGIDVTGSSPPLALSMTRASDGRTVTAADFRGRVVMLYFGYVSCPDACPLTMSRIAHVLDNLGPLASQVRVLFVTVDPERDTLPVLRDYASAFGADFVGLRGTPDALAALARRYRIAYSITPATADAPEAVTHSSAVYVFDRTGRARLLIPGLASQTPDLDGVTQDMRRLIAGDAPKGMMQRMWDALRGMV